MKYYIKNSAKVLFDYAIALIIFVVFIYVLLSLTGDNFNNWIPPYSILLFLFAFFLIYTDMKSIAIKEKKPQYNLNPYPLKGLVYGLIGAMPIALIVAVASLISLKGEVALRLREVAINTFLGPLYFLIRWLDESPIGYASAILLLPLIATLGYLAGYYGINITEKIFKKKPVPEKGFTKSPWNPSIGKEKKVKKKKSKA